MTSGERTVWVEGVPVAEIYQDDDGRWTALMIWWRTAKSADTEEEIIEIAQGWTPRHEVDEWALDFVIEHAHKKHEGADPCCPLC